MSQDVLTARAPAKVNLTLQIKGKRPDGYHELESLVMFADFGDEVAIRAAPCFALTMDGPFADALDGVNLIERAVAAYADAYGASPSILCHLTKNLPVAAGLGGGSSDAAATLRMLREMFGRPKEVAALVPIAGRLGADIPCCLYGRAAMMRGVGEQVIPLADVPEIPAVLFNPLQPLATRDVFRTLNAAPLADLEPAEVPSLKTLDAVIAYAEARSNDLEPVAASLLPVVADMLAVLRRLPGVRLARLSGSGPSCFALFASFEDAEDATLALRRDHPGWWAQPVRLG